MESQQQHCCFCTLALGKKYRDLTIRLAHDLNTHYPTHPLLVLTDFPDDFDTCKNVIALRHSQQGVLLCYNDKRFVLREALARFAVAIHIDADTQVTNSVAIDGLFNPGIMGFHTNLVDHLQTYRPSDLERMKILARKFQITIETTQWIGESLFVVGQEQGKEQEFLKVWGKMASYLELYGIHAGEGNTMGLAAAKVGWTVQTPAVLQNLKRSIRHLDASKTDSPNTKWDRLKQRVKYHYRLNRSRVFALRDIGYYYL